MINNFKAPYAVVIIAFALVPAIISLFYFQDRDRSCADNNLSACQIDLLEESRAGDWALFGDLAAGDFQLRRNEIDNEIEIRRSMTPASKFRSGVTYTAGLFSSSWYEVTGDFRAEGQAGDSGAQLEIESDRWRFITDSAGRARKPWKHVDAFFRPADASPTVDISCHLWSAKSGHLARTLFKTLQIRRIQGSPPRRWLQFDLQKQEQMRLAASHPKKQGSVRSLGVALLLLSAVVGVCWRLAE